MICYKDKNIWFMNGHRFFFSSKPSISIYVIKEKKMLLQILTMAR